MKNVFRILYLLVCVNVIYAQEDVNTALDLTLSYRGLTRQDITIPASFDKDKSPTNDFKLLIPVVKDIMQEPLKSSEFMDEISYYSDLDLIALLTKVYKLKDRDISFSGSPVPNHKIKSSYDFSQSIIEFVKERKTQVKKVLGNFSKEELKFLSENLLSIIEDNDKDDESNSNIFRFNEERDSAIAVSKRVLDILNKKKFINDVNNRFYDAENCYNFFKMLAANPVEFSDNESISNNFVNGKFYFYYDEDGIRIAIGGRGKNIYSGRFDFIIDAGGDDIYNIGEKSFQKFFQTDFSCIMDLSGNDYYSASYDYCLAGAIFSSGFIFDKEGDDTYKGRNVSLGASIGGLGILYDVDGNDTYHANQFSIGAASFGIGLLVDKNGNDVYIANSFSQGFGMTEGVGAIADSKGNDSYLIDARSLDIGRYEDHYISMSQGFGFGLRPYYAGGIGLIIEGEGNDFYATDIFGQGAAYWYSLGCIADKSGHDKYNSYQYSQGAGIHLALGLLKDYDGWDLYSANGVSQGCGHDFGFGLLHDVKGNDNYSAYSLSQGTGNANGIGIIIDESGRDGYLNKEPGNTRGYGNSRREYGSIGIFLDVSGDDFYSVGGMDSTISNSSMWGVMDDFYLKDLPAQISGNNFKIPLDSNKNYSLTEYFIMAKTLEPRFSQWKEYGYRKLVEDSMRTNEFILKYLDTDDHRESLVLRNLAFKIGYTLGNFFENKLKLYNSSAGAQSVFNQNQLAFICYLFGETRNSIGKNELLNLTYTENIRVKSSAVNALGKILIDSNDTEFIDKTSKRLRELAEQKSQYKLFNKDIAYAFNNYTHPDNILTLMDLMNSDYYGVRFLAAEALKNIGSDYYSFVNTYNLNAMFISKIWTVTFLNSILNIPETNVELIVSKILSSGISDDSIWLNLIEFLGYRIRNSESADFRQWAERQIDELKKISILKVK